MASPWRNLTLKILGQWNCWQIEIKLSITYDLNSPLTHTRDYKQNQDPKLNEYKSSSWL